MAKPDQETLELLAHKIDSEGFDYCFMEYSSWREIEDEKFRTLLDAYEKARNAFKDFLEDEWKINDLEDYDADFNEFNEEEEEEYFEEEEEDDDEF